jgi:hypothetical protein
MKNKLEMKSVKRPYAKPVLTKFGNVKELTQGSGTRLVADVQGISGA